MNRQTSRVTLPPNQVHRMDLRAVPLDKPCPSLPTAPAAKSPSRRARRFRLGLATERGATPRSPGSVQALMVDQSEVDQNSDDKPVEPSVTFKHQTDPGDGDGKRTNAKDGDTRAPSNPAPRRDPLECLPMQERTHPQVLRAARSARRPIQDDSVRARKDDRKDQETEQLSEDLPGTTKCSGVPTTLFRLMDSPTIL